MAPIVIAVVLFLVSFCLYLVVLAKGLGWPSWSVLKAFELAKPESPWARYFYGPEKLARPRRRYQNSGR